MKEVKLFISLSLSVGLGLAIFCSVAIVLSFSSTVQAQKVHTVYRKTEHVDFDATDVNGVARSPDGAYISQKRAVKFLPLYHVKLNFDRAIKQSVQFVR